ncbi:MAG: hypothetical protein ACFNMC_00125 [Veillonella parvula]
MVRLVAIDAEKLAIKCSNVKCVPNVRDYGSEIIIYYRFRGWWLNIQWITSNLMGLTKNEIEHIKGMAQCKYNMYYAKSVVSNI